jgi:hypothetical protein
MSDSEAPTTDDRTDRFNQHIYDLDLHDPEADLSGVECTPMDHAGVPAFVFAIGPNAEDVRKAKVCTECQMAMEETGFPDAVALTMEGVGGVIDQVQNTTEDTQNVTIPLSEVLEGRDTDVGTPIHAGIIDGDLHLQFTEE